MKLSNSVFIALISSVSLFGCSSAVQHSTAAASAQPATALSLQRIYQDKEFKAETAPYFRWLDDGSGYTVLEPRDKTKKTETKDEDHGVKGNDIVFYQPDGTGRKVLVSLEQLTPEGAKEALSIEDYQWSDNGQWLLLFSNGEKVWRSRSRGDFWVLNLKTNLLYQLGGAKPEAKKLMFAKFAPDSQKVAYVKNNNIYMESLGSKSVTALTSDGSANIVNGNFDWVYEEEFSIADGFRWSPDSQNIAYWQLDTSGVSYFTMINNTDSLYPQLTQFPYPKAGEKNSAVRIGVVNTKDKQTRWAQLAGDNRDRYIPRISWAGTSDAVLIQDVNRPQNSNSLQLFDWKKQRLTLLFTEKDPAFLEWYYETEWEKDGSHFLWHSERDGWRHLYRVSRDGKSIVNLTPGNYDVIELLTQNEASNSFYFIASPDNASQRYLFKGSLDGSSPVIRLTPAQYEGQNSYYMAKDGSRAMHSYSSFNQPPVSQIIQVEGHKTVKALTRNAELKAKLAKENLPRHEFFQVPARDGVMLDAWVMFPPNMDKSKKYPVIFYVYGEPWGTTVQDVWGGNNYMWTSMMAQKGFIMASVDNRGARAPKGRDWRKSIYKQLGTITVRDQVDALDAMAKRWPVLDTERVGVWGHSGGGSSTLNLLFRHGDKFKVGAAFAPVADIRLYDSIYQERYSGNPHTDPKSYDTSSPINFVKGLQGKLLLVHGTGDDNVHYQGTEKLVNELIKQGKDFEFMAYPNRSHSISEGEGTTLHLQRLKTSFFEKHLLN